MTLHLGILLALLCAVASNVAFFYKHRGACEACAVDIKHFPHREVAVVVQVVRTAWPSAQGLAPARGRHLAGAALDRPGGPLRAASTARRDGGEALRPDHHAPAVVGLALMALGLILLGITLPASEGSHSTFSGSPR